MIEAIIISLKLGFSFFLWILGVIIPIVILIAIFKFGFDLLMDYYDNLHCIIGLIIVLVGFILMLSYAVFFFIYYSELSLL